MKIRLLLAGALFLGLGAFSHAQSVDPGIVPRAPQPKIPTLKQQLSELEQLRFSMLRKFKPNSPEIRVLEANIRVSRPMIKGESPALNRADEKRVWNQIIAQLEHERRAFSRQPKTDLTRRFLQMLDIHIQIARARRNGSGARPTPTPQVQLLSR